MEPWSSRKQLGVHHGSPRPRVVLGFNECSWTHPIMLAPMSSIHHSLPKPSPIVSKLWSNMFNYMSVVTQPNTSEFCVYLQASCQKIQQKNTSVSDKRWFFHGFLLPWPVSCQAKGTSKVCISTLRRAGRCDSTHGEMLRAIPMAKVGMATQVASCWHTCQGKPSMIWYPILGPGAC